MMISDSTKRMSPKVDDDNRIIKDKNLSTYSIFQRLWIEETWSDRKLQGYIGEVGIFEAFSRLYL